ncbi:hypothetical protein L226DRAFT_546393 [Lentinus tigrinus ALCF2SS1-7]|uniref:Conidiation protein 6 n=1 Tax=Lentinus tigrinus ALCF2SS1-6 TaxID=1328759 RepID=A0A5C2RRC3_9APHY|nr:hypothetical protein L227DRAFT_369549 [Lentinus tigrinus ALCF2SS1-6]RPD73831.1 hypothetical protein L226DRAFT_546393 [Lentinus tigrinus ALCF2SS1-7]
MSSYDHEKRVAAGLKAAIHNPNVSDEARERAQERLEHSSDTSKATGHSTGATDQSGHEVNRVLGGYKATLHNPNTSAEAKQHAREMLDAQAAGGSDDGDDLHQTRVKAGYKAALHNPRVSEEAKEHAREYLEEQGESA